MARGSPASIPSIIEAANPVQTPVSPFATFVRDQAMVVVCYHGHSSQQAATWLAGQGFAHVYSLDGGFTDWEHRHPQRVMRQS